MDTPRKPDALPDSRAPLAVSCRGVTKAYGQGQSKVMALRGVDLTIACGELMMLVGPSGCGKTTLISVIAGILDRDEGECGVFGNDFAHMSQRAKTRWRGSNIGFVFQAFNLLPTLNAAENAAVPLMILGEGRHAAVKRAREMLDRVGLGDRWKSLPSQLSGGQQQRVAIARALIHGPKLIVCDEPTSALDHETGHVIMRLMKTIAVAEDRALVIVTHDARIFGFADRIARMDDGRVERIVRDPADLQT
ncbi:MAG: ABC transporter ATP-binding protein [Planctomycetes bacterium]|nr:ABC transporter ATP-binding protein [Planctomycetota bacterium]